MENKVIEALSDLVKSQGYALIDVSSKDDNPSEMCPIYMGIGAARRCLDLKQYKAADGILDALQEELENKNEN